MTAMQLESQIQNTFTPAEQCLNMTMEELRQIGSVLVFNAQRIDEVTCVILEGAQTLEALVEAHPNYKNTARLARHTLELAITDGLARSRIHVRESRTVIELPVRKIST